MRTSIIIKITALLLLMLIVAIANVALIYFYQTQQRHDAHIINVAGRQRMLSQQISKLSLSVANGNDADRKPLGEAMELYGNSLKALCYGGEAMENYIPPAPKACEELFQKNKNLWVVFKEKVEIVVKERRDNPSFTEAIIYVKDNNEVLLKASDDVATAYHTLPNANEYVHEINLAGRQRMLSQKISKHALAIATGADKERKKLEEAIELYDASFLAMRDGGVSIPWGKEVKIPPPGVREVLNHVEDIWYAFKAKVSIIQEEHRNNKSFIEGVEYIRLNNDKLLKVSDLITLTFDEIFSKKVVFLRDLLFAMLGITGLSHFHATLDSEFIA